MRFKTNRAQWWRIAVLSAAILVPVFAAYLWMLYRQLDRTFSQDLEYIPTRIYSDVSRIAPPQPRFHVEGRLKSLGYGFEPGAEKLSFSLHPIDYPQYLIPDNHPSLDSSGSPVTLTFQGTDKDAPLQSVSIGDQEVPDVYLEPELVAILSRGNKDGQDTRQIRAKLGFADVPAMVWKAIIAVEDQHFLEHSGFDPRGVARAIWVNLRTASFAQGGSTITQQLVKNLMARKTKNLFRKVNELFLSILLEFKFDKETILERYLNEVYLGQIGSFEIHGVAEGAEHFFGRKVDELNLGEIALMAGLIRGPYYYSPYRYKERALERQRLVLKKMVETGMIAEAEAQSAAKMPIRLAPPRTSANKAPYFTDFVKAELIRQLKEKIAEEEVSKAGFRVYTTLDMRLNQSAQESVAQGISDLEKKLKVMAPDRLEGALASVDHSTGYIRALVGGRDYSQSTFNRILNMRRQVGSTFKPIVYLAAFDKGLDPRGVPFGPGYPMEDSPWKLIYDRGNQTWAPKNYEKDYRGWVTLRTALAHSINTVAAKLGYEVGIENVIKTARALGIESELPAVPSLSLGVAELSPVELLRAYATIANHGIQDDLTVIRGITQADGTGYARFIYHPKQVFDPGPIDLLTDVMTSIFTEGTARAAFDMGFDAPAAGKTGTTSHHRDSWFAGFTPQLTTVVWVGMDQMPVKGDDASVKRPKIALTGATSALPIWVNYMKSAIALEPANTFPLSPHLENVMIDLKSGRQADPSCPAEQTAMEKYIKDREPKDSSCEALWPESVPETRASF